MTVQELIDALREIGDKGKEVFICTACDEAVAARVAEDKHDVFIHGN